jgi:hypothetical protein
MWMSFGGQQMPMASNMGQQQQMGQNQPQGMMPMYPGMAPQSGMMPQMGQMPQGQMGGIGGLMPEYMMGMSQGYSQPMGEILPQDPTKVDMKPTNMGQTSSMSQPSSMTEPSSLGAMPSYRPTMGPINAAEVASRMDIRQPRQMSGLPNSIANQLPPSLKRPTQGSYKNFK